MKVIAIDPGSEHSAYVLVVDGSPTAHGWILNAQLLAKLREGFADGCHLAIETMHPRGELASLDAFNTQIWAGRYIEAVDFRGGGHTKIDPADSRLAVCGKSNVKDSQIRQSLIDRFGGDNLAIGGKRCPDCNDGNVWHTGPCTDCHQTGRQPGPRGERKCPRCKGRTTVRERVTCATCKGTQWLYPPGILAGYNEHERSALAAAICFLELPLNRR